MNEAITIEHLSFKYSPQQPWVVSDISLAVPKGSCCAILGPTSAGKSTLLHAVAGILGKHHRSSKTLGSIKVEDVRKPSLGDDLLFPDVGIVLQDPYVMISGIYETVQEELAFTLYNLEIPEAVIEERVAQTLRFLNLAHLAHRHPLHLSGGEVQRVALGTILVAEPKILLIDEPRNSLDCDGQDTLVQLLRSLQPHTTVLFTDYQIELALAVADSVLVLNEGKNLFYGNKREFISRYREFASLLFPREWDDAILRLVKEGAGQRHVLRLAKIVGL